MKKKLFIICIVLLLSMTTPVFAFHEHSYTVWTVLVPADCLSEGLAESFCDVCGNQKFTNIPKTKHKWIEYQRLEPTCSPGYIYEYCEYCSKEVTEEIPAIKKHKWGKWFIIEKPTVFRYGEKMRTCKECNDDSTKKIKKLKPFIKFSKKKITINTNQKKKLKTKYAKGDSIKKWKSNNKRVAVVSKKGKVTGINKGTAKITAVTKTRKKAICIIKVK